MAAIAAERTKNAGLTLEVDLERIDYPESALDAMKGRGLRSS
jgi:hypothetical protein